MRARRSSATSIYRKAWPGLPVLIGVHGGGWQLGNRKFYNNWGAYLARNGIATFAIEYRLMTPGREDLSGRDL